jgi:hypothetical protein
MPDFEKTTIILNEKTGFRPLFPKPFSKPTGF